MNRTAAGFFHARSRKIQQRSQRCGHADSRLGLPVVSLTRSWRLVWCAVCITACSSGHTMTWPLRAVPRALLLGSVGRLTSKGCIRNKAGALRVSCGPSFLGSQNRLRNDDSLSVDADASVRPRSQAPRRTDYSLALTTSSTMPPTSANPPAIGGIGMLWVSSRVA